MWLPSADSSELMKMESKMSTIDVYLTLWVYDVFRTIILSKLAFKKQVPQVTSELRLKDIEIKGQLSFEPGSGSSLRGAAKHISPSG